MAIDPVLFGEAEDICRDVAHIVEEYRRATLIDQNTLEKILTKR